MDDELLKLEAELKQLRPAQPSFQLEGRLDSAMNEGEAPQRRGQMLKFGWLAPIAIAAALVLVGLCLQWRPRISAPATVAAAVPSSAKYKAVAAENLLLSSADEGYVTLSDGTVARRIRQTYVDTITWQNPRTHASLKWRLPREEVRFEALALQ